MPLPTLPVVDGNGNPATIFTPRSGRANDEDSAGVALSNEDLAALNAIAPAIAAAIASAVTALLGAPATGAATAANQAAGNTLLNTIANELAGTLTVQFPESSPQSIAGSVTAIFDALTYPGLTPSDTVTVVDGTAELVFIDYSGTTVGGAETLRPLDANRKGVEFQNTSDVNMRIRFVGAAGAAAGFLVQPGKTFRRYYKTCPKGAISIWCGEGPKTYQLLVA